MIINFLRLNPVITYQIFDHGSNNLVHFLMG